MVVETGHYDVLGLHRFDAEGLIVQTRNLSDIPTITQQLAGRTQVLDAWGMLGLGVVLLRARAVAACCSCHPSRSPGQRRTKNSLPVTALSAPVRATHI